MGLALIVHGGAGTISRARHAQAQAGCRAAALAGWAVLQEGGSALDAVQRAVIALEDDPTFNAGTGATLTSDGRVELDAGIMDGHTLDAGAVAGVERIKNPIILARHVLASPHVLLVGPGAGLFAQEEGLALCDPDELITDWQRERWRNGYCDPEADTATEPHGTVGAVAVDSAGHLAAATSTGGMANKHPGRVGDSPLIGCGFYAEDGLGAASSTGHGEYFMRTLLAKRAVDLLADGRSAQEAATAAITFLAQRVGGDGGIILVDHFGTIGHAHNTPNLVYALMREGMANPEAGV
jgi:beta-aspartyl-peptidase (threonine type)